MPKVSIIVPIYGVEQFIERCAQSLFEQTYDDLEYIFVDDCTKDHSIVLLKKLLGDYPRRKNNVKILHHEYNKGLPQARRTGILAASGDYIINVDSDDWVDTAMVESLLKRAENEQSDMVIFDYVITNEITRIVHKGCIHLEKEKLLKDLCPMRVSWAVWNKMIRRTLIDSDIVFPTENMGEDMGLIMQLILKAKNISYEPQAFYYYYQNPDSITREITEETICRKYTQHINNLDIVLNSFCKLGLDEKYADCIVALKWNVRKGLWGLTHDKEYYNKWKGTYPEIEKKILFCRSISIADKLRYVLTRFHIYPFKKDRVFFF